MNFGKVHVVPGRWLHPGGSDGGGDTVGVVHDNGELSLEDRGSEFYTNK